jgi:ABC-type uncharacterized transport system auxiliary subunit
MRTAIKKLGSSRLPTRELKDSSQALADALWCQPVPSAGVLRSRASA